MRVYVAMLVDGYMSLTGEVAYERRVCSQLLKYRESNNAPAFVIAILTSLSPNLAAACRLVISLSLGCCQVPGDGVGCTFDVEDALEFAGVRTWTALVFARTIGCTTVVETVPDMVGESSRALSKIRSCGSSQEVKAHSAEEETTVREYRSSLKVPGC